MGPLSSPADILTYWFGDGSILTSLHFIQTRMGVWFTGIDQNFNRIQHESVELMHQIADQSANGTLSDDWLTPNGVLARVLLLDQFPREVFRGTAAAFQFDAIAAGLVRDAVRTGTFLSGTYSTIQRFFMCVALQHSELLADQVLGVELASQISHDATDDVKQFFMNLPGYPLEHRDVIARFNRFPSRNAALGRVSTAEELSWMASPECPKWARSQMVTPAS